MSLDEPNRIVMVHGSHFSAHFGACYAAVPMHHVHGLGHGESIKVHFLGGLSLELTRSAAIELARRLPEAVAGLPLELGDGCAGATVDLGEGA